MNSVTDELRRLLDERGVEYRWDNGTATWYVDGVMYNAWGYDNERLTMSVCHLTPAQAIDAALGRGTCRMTEQDDGFGWWECSECSGILPAPDIINYCPNCGRRVIGDVDAN